MQMLVTGFLLSLILWAIISFAALKGAVRLFRDGVLGERWLLVAPYLFASLVFYGIRYRFSPWFMDRQAVHELFSIGAYMPADGIAFVVCVLLFYVISVLKPEWILRTQVNVPLLILLPFVIKLACYASGLAGWEALPAKIMPTRVE